MFKSGKWCVGLGAVLLGSGLAQAETAVMHSILRRPSQDNVAENAINGPRISQNKPIGNAPVDSADLAPPTVTFDPAAQSTPTTPQAADNRVAPAKGPTAPGRPSLFAAPQLPQVSQRQPLTAPTSAQPKPVSAAPETNVPDTDEESNDKETPAEARAKARAAKQEAAAAKSSDATAAPRPEPPRTGGFIQRIRERRGA